MTRKLKIVTFLEPGNRRHRGSQICPWMPSIKRTLPPIPTTLFNYAESVFSTTRSRLSDYIFNSYVTLINPRTGGKMAFDLFAMRRESDGEVIDWQFRSAKGTKLLIINV